MLNKFNSVPDLPISEEILGAYIEGRLDPLENLRVSSILEVEPELSSLMDAELDSSYDSFPFQEADIPVVDLDNIVLPDIDFQSLPDFDLNSFHPDSFNSESPLSVDTTSPFDALGADAPSVHFPEDFFSSDDRFPHIDESLDIDPEPGEDNLEIDSLM